MGLDLRQSSWTGDSVGRILAKRNIGEIWDEMPCAGTPQHSPAQTTINSNFIIILQHARLRNRAALAKQLREGWLFFRKCKIPLDEPCHFEKSPPVGRSDHLYFWRLSPEISPWRLAMDQAVPTRSSPQPRSVRLSAVPHPMACDMLAEQDACLVRQDGLDQGGLLPVRIADVGAAVHGTE